MRDKVIMVRVSADEKEELFAVANRAGISVSALLRAAALRDADAMRRRVRATVEERTFVPDESRNNQEV